MIICALCNSGHGLLPMAAGGQSSGPPSKGYPLSFYIQYADRRHFILVKWLLLPFFLCI